MSRKIVTEDSVNLLQDIDVEFISLVRHGAIQDGFRIVKGDNNMSKQFYKILAPSDVNEEKLNEIAKEYELSLEQKSEDELEGYYTFKQAEDEQFELEYKELIALDKDNHIYGIAAPAKTEGNEIQKESLDYETMDTLADGIFATMDIMLGAMRMPEADNSSRKQMMLDAVSNLQKHIEAVLSTTKADEVLDIDNIEISEKYENLAELFYQVTESGDAELEKEEQSEEIKKQVYSDLVKYLSEEISANKGSIYAKVDEKLTAKAEELLAKAQANSEEILENFKQELSEETKTVVSKETFENKIKELSDSLDEIKNTTKIRQSEVEEEHEEVKETKKAIAGKFFTAV